MSGAARARDRGIMITAVVTALFSSHAMDLGALIVMLWDGMQGSNPKRMVEAGLVVLALGFLVLLLLNGRRALASDTQEDHAALATGIAVGLLGGFFSIIDKTVDANGVPEDATIQGVLILAATAGIFFVPLIALPNRGGALSQLLLRLALAAMIAGLAAGALQHVCTMLRESWPDQGSGHFFFGSTSFWLSAPSTAALFAGWALVAVDPLLRPERWRGWTVGARLGWCGGYALAALALSALYALNYARRHGEAGNAWARIADIDPSGMIAVFLLLQLPAILLAALAVLLRRPGEGESYIRRGDIPWLLAVLGIAGACAAAVAMPLRDVPKIGMSALDARAFAVVHGLTAVIAVAAVLASHRARLPKRKARRGFREPR